MLQKSKCIDDILVSTDSEKIASYAKSIGASVPFLRKKNFQEILLPQKLLFKMLL